MKKCADFWPYFGSIIWRDFVNVWQNTPVQCGHYARACLPHWCCRTALPDCV